MKETMIEEELVNAFVDIDNMLRFVTKANLRSLSSSVVFFFILQQMKSLSIQLKYTSTSKKTCQTFYGTQCTFMNLEPKLKPFYKPLKGCKKKQIEGEENIKWISFIPPKMNFYIKILCLELALSRYTDSC